MSTQTVVYKAALSNTKADMQRIGECFFKHDIHFISKMCLNWNWNRSTVWVLFKCHPRDIEKVKECLSIDEVEYRSPTYMDERGSMRAVYDSAEDQINLITTDAYKEYAKNRDKLIAEIKTQIKAETDLKKEE